MKKQSKYAYMFIALSLLLTLSIYISTKGTTANAMENDVDLVQLNQISEGRDFADDCVMVVLDSEVSEVNKIHSKEFFSGVEVDYIKDLTWRENGIGYVSDNFRQILQIFIKNSTKEKVLQAIAALENVDGIDSVEPNYIMQMNSVINDTYYQSGDLWGLGENGIQIEKAWEITTGSRDIRIGVLDTGINSHVDLNENVVGGYDFFNNDNNARDDEYEHGTQVAGIIGAGSNGHGIVGVNWSVSLISLQALNESKEIIDTFAVTAAINYAADLYGTENEIDVINYSVSGFGTNKTVKAAVSNYHGLFVWAAGNEEIDVDALISQYNFGNMESVGSSNIISVGGLDESGERFRIEHEEGTYKGSNYSSSGINVSVYAPGHNIYSTIGNLGYDYGSGTSMAAPYVTGVAALMLSIKPNLSASEIKEKIIESADDITITDPNGNEIQVKKLNAYEALKSVIYETNLAGNVITVVNVPDKVNVIGVPDKINGKNITAIGDNAFEYCTKLTEITIPDSIISIGNEAFRACTNLSNIIFGANSELVSIGESAFANTAITQIYVPISVESIGLGAFEYCKNLTTIKLLRPSSMGITITNLAVPADDMDKVYPNLTSIVVPNKASSDAYKENLSLFPQLAAIIENEQFVYFSLDDGTYSIVKGDDDIVGELIIPSMYNHKAVTQIGFRAFKGCASITSVTMPSTITSISISAFEDCSGLTQITIPNSVTFIGGSAFKGCSGLTQITLPNSITSISNDTFSGCSGLLDITIPNSVTSIGMAAFSGCSGLTYVRIPSSVSLVNATPLFGGCENLLTIELQVETLDFGYSYNYTQYFPAMWHYVVMTKDGKELRYLERTSLTTYSVISAQGLQYTLLEDGTFAVSSVLASMQGTLVIPSYYNGKPVTEIKGGAFSQCKNLSKLVFLPNSNITKIGQYAFYNCSSLQDFTVPSSVSTISDYAFSGCDSLTVVYLPDNNLQISDNAFLNCLSLEHQIMQSDQNSEVMGLNFTLLLSDGTYSVSATNSTSGQLVIPSFYNGRPVTTIGANAFSGCTGISSVILPYTVTTIGASAFSGCTQIKYIKIPSNVTSIGNNAFANCTGLKAVNLPDTIVELNDSAFTNCINLIKIIVSSDIAIYNAYIAQFESQSVKDKIVSSDGGLIYTMLDDGTYEVSSMAADIEGELIIPEYYDGAPVTAIADFAFTGCSSLTYVELPFTITSIGSYAFAGTGIEDMIIPDSVLTVGNNAFANCTSLGVVPLLRTAEQGITEIHPTAFSGSNLVNIVVFDEDSYYDYYDYFEEEMSGLEDYLQYVMYFN